MWPRVSRKLPFDKQMWIVLNTDEEDKNDNWKTYRVLHRVSYVNESTQKQILTFTLMSTLSLAQGVRRRNHAWILPGASHNLRISCNSSETSTERKAC